MPGGKRWVVRRIDHQLRKILPEDRVTSEVSDQKSGESIKIIALKGSEIRKKGLRKDIANKALGTDGIITSAEFILYPKFEATRTICLDFFGQDMEDQPRDCRTVQGIFPNSA